MNLTVPKIIQALRPFFLSKQSDNVVQGDLRSENYSAGFAGWQITSPEGNAEFNDVVARGAFSASTFVMNEYQISGGTQIVARGGRVRSTATVAASFSVDIDDPETGHGTIASVGEVVRFKSWNGSSVLDVWATVTAVTDMTTHYRYTVSVNGTSSGASVPAGSIMVVYGQDGDGIIMLTSDQNEAPFVSVISTGAQPWVNVKETVRLGKLDGLNLDIINPYKPDLYGLVAGANLTTNSSTGGYLAATDEGVFLRNADIKLYNGALQTVEILSDGDLKLGTNVASLSTTGLSFDAGTGDLIIGRKDGSGSEKYVMWNAAAGTLTVKGATSLDALSAFSANLGTITAGTITGATIRTAASGARVEMSGTRIFGTNGTTTQWEALGSSLLAGAGAVKLDASGITITPGTSVYNEITWSDGSNTSARITALIDIYQQEAHIQAVRNNSLDTVIGGIEAVKETGQYMASVQALSDGTYTYATMRTYDIVDNSLSAFISVASHGEIYMSADGGNIIVGSNIAPETTGIDLGASGSPFNAIYVNEMHTGTVFGVITGPEWTYTGNMVIDAESASDTIVNVINSGAGTALFQVESNTVWHAGNMIIGTHVQAWDADLSAIAALAKDDSNFIVGNGSTWVVESGSVARTSLGLGTASSPTFAGLTITGNIAVTGTVDGVDVSAHKSRHESGGADAINHDSLTGFVANEHIDHTAVSISAGTMLTGGGTIASTRTLNVNLDYDPTWTGLHTFTEHTEMESVDINGALTVTDDLTVTYGGFSPLFVNVDTVNPNNSNVGIMPQNLPGGVPDPQFALDIGGAARAQYFVGPHAIQLSDAALIAHYDGPYPFETNFSGFAAGHLGQVATETGGVIYRPGKFGKAVQLAEATTNLVTNPSFEVSTSGWSSSWGDTISRSTEQAKYGLYSLKIAADGSTNGQGASRDTTVTAGQTYTISCWVYVPSSYTGADPSPRVYDGANFITALGAVAITERDQWVYWSTTQTITSTTIRFLLYASANVAAGQAFYLDAVQIEQKAYATPYCLHPDSMVASDRGVIRLDDVQIGDRLLGSNGFNNIEAKWDVYTDAYEITFKNGYSVVASEDHRFLATKWPWDYNESSGWRFREVKELVPGDYVKLSQKENIADGSDEPEMAYLLGYLIGDGYFCSSDSKGKPRIAWTFGVDYAYMADHVSAMYNKCMPPSPNGGVSKFPSHRKSNDSEIMLTTHSSLVANTLLDHGVKPDTGALGKSVPLCVWNYKKGDLLSFLAGLIDSDGSVDVDGAIKIDSASEKLIDNIRLLVSMRLGVHGHISAPRDTNNFSGRERVMHRIRFTKADSAYLFSLGLPVHHLIKRERLAQSSESKFRRREWAQVDSIKHIGKQRLIDITIGPDHDFVAEGLITHNCDGSLGTGHTWAGTAHASTSSRTAAQLYYATPMQGNIGTVFGWFKPTVRKNYRPATTNYQSLFECHYGGNGPLLTLQYTSASDGVLALYGLTSGPLGLSSSWTPDAEQWTFFAVTWDGSNVTLYGGKEGDESLSSNTSLQLPGRTFSNDVFRVGNWNNTFVFNGLIDDLVILNRVADAAEIRSIYESNAPVFAESSIEVWRTPTQVPIWVDSEGMWMRAVGGGETLGAYGGDATKSWGGKTLYQSDFLLGNATNGYIHWHAFQNPADPWGKAGMEVKAEMDITGNSSVSGELSAGDGSVVLSSTGIYIDSGTNENLPVSTKTLRLGLSGKLYAAETVVSTLDAGWLVLESSGYGQLSNLELRAINTDPSGNGYVRMIADGMGGARTVVLYGGGHLDVGTSIQMSGFAQYLRFKGITDAQQSGLSAVEGTVVYNSDDKKLRVYNGSSWVDLH